MEEKKKEGRKGMRREGGNGANTELWITLLKIVKVISTTLIHELC